MRNNSTERHGVAPYLYNISKSRVIVLRSRLMIIQYCDNPLQWTVGGPLPWGSDFVSLECSHSCHCIIPASLLLLALGYAGTTGVEVVVTPFAKGRSLWNSRKKHKKYRSSPYSMWAVPSLISLPAHTGNSAATLRQQGVPKQHLLHPACRNNTTCTLHQGLPC